MSTVSDSQGPNVRPYLFPNSQSGGKALDCPVCQQGPVTIFDCEEWFSCEQCGAAGDFFELLSLSRRLRIEEVMAIALQDHPDAASLTPEQIEAYLKQQAEQKQVNEFWEKARYQPAKDLTTQGMRMLRDLWLGDHALRPTWCDRGAQLYGVASLDAINQLPRFASNSELPETTERITRSGSEEVVVIPHHDLPGRICGFTLLTGDMRTNSIEIAYRQVLPSGETGIACAGAVSQGSHPIWGNKLFVIDDTWSALQFHARNFRDGSRPIPLVAIPQFSERFLSRTPPLLQGWKVVFCGSLERNYLMAKNQSGLISDYVPTESDLAPCWLPTHALSRCQQHARPWLLALHDQIQGFPSDYAVKFIRSLGDPQPEERAQQVAKMCVSTDDPPLQGESKNVGWAADPHRLRLPHFCICEDGCIEWTRFEQERHQAADDMDFLPSITDIPGFGLLPPMDDPKAVQTLSIEADTVSLVWALAACFIQHLTAQHGHDEEPMGIVLEGSTIHQAGRKLALALGCGQVAIWKGNSRSVRSALGHYGEFHDFPCLVRGPAEGIKISKSWLRDSDLRRLILPLTPSAARTVMTQPGFVRLTTRRSLHVTGSICDAARWVIPTYMTNFLGERKRFSSNMDESIVLTIVEDLAHWFGLQGGKPEAVRIAKSFMRFDADCRQISKPKPVTSASTNRHDGSWMGSGPPRIL